MIFFNVMGFLFLSKFTCLYCFICIQVITKFIQKHKVHQQSWVEDPTLGRKVPLEISLLTTLKHPNIVSIGILILLYYFMAWCLSSVTTLGLCFSFILFIIYLYIFRYSKCELYIMDCFVLYCVSRINYIFVAFLSPKGYVLQTCYPNLCSNCIAGKSCVK